MSKSLWQLQAEGKVVAVLNPTDLFYILRDPQTGRLDRVITAADLAANLGGSGGGGIGVGVTDGDKGDITVTGNGEVWVIDPNAITSEKLADSSVTSAKITNGHVTNAKLAQVANNLIKGRISSGVGDVEDLTPVGTRAVIASDSGNTAHFLRGDGTWATPPVPATVDEVYVGIIDPGTSYELWYDIDEPATLTPDLRWNTAWGVVGIHRLDTTFTTTGTHTTYQDSGLTLTLSPPAGRQWEFTIVVNPYIIGGTTSVGFRLYAGATMLREWNIDSTAVSATGSSAKTLVHTQSLGALGSTVFKVQIAATGASLAVADFGATVQPRQLIVEDIGPVSGAVYAPDPTPTWIPVTFTSPWANVGGMQTAQYRKIGDIVYLRGSVVRSSGTQPIIFTLPSGYRPPGLLQFPQKWFNGSVDAMGATQINNGGDVSAAAGATAGVVTALTIDCQFSVSA